MNRKDTLDLLALSAIWGSSYLFIAFAAEALPPITLVALRLLIGAVSLLIILRLRHIPLPTAPKTLAALAFMGLFNNAIPFTLITWAESPGGQQINSGLAALLVGVVPILTVVIANFTLKDERFTTFRVAGALIGFVGVVVLMSPQLATGSGDQSLSGSLAVFAASVSYAISLIFSRRALSHVKPIVIGATQMMWSTSLLLPLAILIEQPQLANVPARAWVSLLWLGLVGASLAYILYFRLIQSAGATRASMVTYISPVVGVILGILFNSETIHWTLIIAAFLIISGAMLVNRKPREKMQPVRDDPRAEPASAR